MFQELRKMVVFKSSVVFLTKCEKYQLSLFGVALSSYLVKDVNFVVG